MTTFIATDNTGHRMRINAETLEEAELYAESCIGESLSSVAKEPLTQLQKMNRYAEKNNYYGLSTEDIDAMRKVLVDEMKEEVS